MAAGYRIEALAEAVSRAAAGLLAASLHGDRSRWLAGVAPLQTAGSDQLSFLANPRYRAAAASSGAGALVLTAADRHALFGEGATAGPTLVECANPYAWFAFSAQLLAPRGSGWKTGPSNHGAKFTVFSRPSLIHRWMR